MKQPPAAPRRSHLTTEAQAAFVRAGRRRMGWSIAAAFVLLLLLVVLGPDRREIERRFRYYGAPGPLRIMPEISIDQGRDRSHQLPKSLQVPPPPASLQVVPEPESPLANEVRPRERQDPQVLSEVIQPDPDAEIGEDPRVELTLPAQTNPDWYILFMVRPRYPAGAGERDRQQRLVFVRAAIFVGAQGEVTESMILATNGSRVFAEEVLASLAQWKFGWRVNPGVGRWIEMTWNFHSPYAAGARRP